MIEFGTMFLGWIEQLIYDYFDILDELSTIMQTLCMSGIIHVTVMHLSIAFESR